MMMMRAYSLIVVGSSMEGGTKESAEVTATLLTELKKLLTSRLVISYHTENYSLTSDGQVLANFPQKLDNEGSASRTEYSLTSPSTLFAIRDLSSDSDRRKV